MAEKKEATTGTVAAKEKTPRSSRTLTIDGVQYEQDKLSPAAKSQLANIRVVDQEIRRLQMQIAIAQAARVTFSRTLRDELKTTD